jgi:hypothetical protein
MVVTLYIDKLLTWCCLVSTLVHYLLPLTVDGKDSSEGSSDSGNDDADFLGQQNLISNLQNAFSAVSSGSSSSSKGSTDSDAANGAASVAEAAADVTVELELPELSATAG